MAVKLSPIYTGQVLDANGDPLVGGKIYTYASGSSTPLPTFTDATGGTQQANPIILNARGACNDPPWLTEGSEYRFMLYDADDVLVDGPVDNVTGVNDAGNTADQWVASSLTPTYVSATQFTLVGDQTSTFTVNRRLKFTVTAGTVYGYISVSAYTSLTTVTVVLDSGSLDSGLSAVQLGLITPTETSLPKIPNFVSTAMIVDGDVTGTKLLAALRTAMHGKCRLTKSSANLLLSQWNGQTVVDGADNILTVPSAGVTLAPTSATPDTTYYIYASDSDADGDIDLLEYSTTAPTTATNGVKHKTGDTGDILVGMARAITGPAWADTATQRFVRSWFNDPGFVGNSAYSTNRTTTSTSFVEVNSEIRVEFLSWSGEVINAESTYGGSNTTAGTFFLGIGFDGTTPSAEVLGYVQVGSGSCPLPLSLANNGLSEGYHYGTVLARTSSGTLTLGGGASGTQRMQLFISSGGAQ